MSTPASALWTWSVSAKAGRLGFAPSACLAFFPVRTVGQGRVPCVELAVVSDLNLLPVSSTSSTSFMNARVSVETRARQAIGKVPLTVRK